MGDLKGSGFAVRCKFMVVAMVMLTIGGVILPVSTMVFADEPLVYDSDKQYRKLEELLVIGEKTERSLRDTTTSVTVLSGEDVDTSQYTSLYEAVSSTIGIVSDPMNLPSIRGVDGTGSALGFFAFAGGSRPRVVTVVDGKSEPFFAATSGDSGIWDIQQVEVLRGPQSTVQGRNSVGGAIVVVTKDPTMDWQGALRGGYNELDNGIDAAGVISGPILEDQLAFRVAVQHFEGDNFVDYPVPAGGESYPWDPKKIEATNVRAKLLWQPAFADGLNIKLTLNSRDETGPGLKGLVSGPNFFDHIKEYGDSAARYQETTNRNAMLDIEYEFTNNFSADVKFAGTDYDWDFEEFFGQHFVELDEDSRTFDARLKYQSDSDFMTAFIGFYYYEREQEFIRLDREALTFIGDDDTQTQAIYFEADIHFSEVLTVILGGRYEQEEQVRKFDLSWTPFSPDFIIDEDNSVFLPKIAFTYDLNSSSTIGASIRKGYNAGGGNLNFATFEPYSYEKEEVLTYEISSRNSFFDNRITIAANLFYSDFEGYQDTGRGNSGLPDDFRILNVPESTNYGLEFELSSLITDNLQLDVGLALVSAEVDKADTQNQVLEGNKLTRAPDTMASIGLDYQITSVFSLDVHANYISEYFTDISNKDKLVGGDYTIANLGFDYALDTVDFRVYVNNVFDEEVLYSWSGRFAQIGKPRNIGVSATYNF